MINQCHLCNNQVIKLPNIRPYKYIYTKIQSSSFILFFYEKIWHIVFWYTFIRIQSHAPTPLRVRLFGFTTVLTSLANLTRPLNNAVPLLLVVKQWKPALRKETWSNSCFRVWQTSCWTNFQTPHWSDSISPLSLLQSLYNFVHILYNLEPIS